MQELLDDSHQCGTGRDIFDHDADDGRVYDLYILEDWRHSKVSKDNPDVLEVLIHDYLHKEIELV